jgi:glycosyl-4,4'-diaponeurosporenoate acyltransferase
MLVELSVPWLIGVNILAWLFLHLGLAWLGTRLPTRFFRPDGWLCRCRSWEGEGSFYERTFLVKSWKDQLPDGAALFAGGFRKANLGAVTPAYLDLFVCETCRGEAVHWAVLLSGFLFFLWNPWWVGLVMIVYAVAANMPCILVQRYNRYRLTRLGAARRRRIRPGTDSVQ